MLELCNPAIQLPELYVVAIYQRSCAFLGRVIVGAE
jgi:hypothetical protein